ncbi:hypothetical protein SAMN04488548_1342147 [Gordonia westfalica]|uniref:Uncharacterized protein n=1 Tax=Gordonia westfalica TaxID=158898 RepID=A0A1H2JHT4_9ACTN|nr:hypothetical protein SAMN04488548_1342147 [Gordonia westfalica]
MATLPDAGRRRCAISPSNVDLPAPLAPINEYVEAPSVRLRWSKTTVPSGQMNETSDSTMDDAWEDRDVDTRLLKW